jgi:hypothetical protein
VAELPMMVDIRLRQFRERLELLMGNGDDLRPFVCDGNPYDCGAFLVGINPASRVPFWEFWDDGVGFDKKAWSCAYMQRRKAEGRKPISNTRQRIERLVAAAKPVRILETNLYSLPTRTAREIGAKAARDTSLFEILLSEIEPQIIVLHGKEVTRHFERRFGYRLSREFLTVDVNGRRVRIAAAPHLSRVSHQDAEDWGASIQSHYVERG